MIVEVLIAEPGELSLAELDAAETLVRPAFGSGFRSHDWRRQGSGLHRDRQCQPQTDEAGRFVDTVVLAMRQQ